MNEQSLADSQFLRHPDDSGATHRIRRWNKSVAIGLIIIFAATLIQPGLTRAEDQMSGSNGSESTGMQVSSWLLTVPYCLGKSAFAIAGGVVGGLGYVFSGGNAKTAKSVWVTSIKGTYLIRPAHLRGEEPIHFLGKPDDSQAEPASHPIQHASEQDKPLKK